MKELREERRIVGKAAALAVAKEKARRVARGIASLYEEYKKRQRDLQHPQVQGPAEYENIIERPGEWLDRYPTAPDIDPNDIEVGDPNFDSRYVPDPTVRHEVDTFGDRRSSRFHSDEL